jgi:hypothetical protein
MAPSLRRESLRLLLIFALRARSSRAAVFAFRALTLVVA